MKKTRWIIIISIMMLLGIIGSASAQVGDPAPGGPGLYELELKDDSGAVVGTVQVWNTVDFLNFSVKTDDGALIQQVKLYVGTDPIPVDGGGSPALESFPFESAVSPAAETHAIVLDLYEDLGFAWGEPYEDERIQNLAVYATVDGADTWAAGEGTFAGTATAWWFRYELEKPIRGQFAGPPVAGLTYRTPSHAGTTDTSGAFDFFSGEKIRFDVGNIYLGEPLAAKKVYPVNLFVGGDSDDIRVINVARLLQSLDAEGDPKDGIEITDPVIGCLNEAVNTLSFVRDDFADEIVEGNEDNNRVTMLIRQTIANCAGVDGVNLIEVSAEDAMVLLEKALSNSMFRKNVSKTPELDSAKSKLNIMAVWLPALKANGDPATYIDEGGAEQPGIAYYDETGNFIRSTESAKPLVTCYTDEIEGTSGASDVFCAASRDDGATWKRKNISRSADRSSFQLATGFDYPGTTKKPVFQVKGNNVLVAWTSKFCHGGKPAYAIEVCPDTDGDGNPDPCEVCYGSDENEKCGIDYTVDDPYYQEDIFGIAGPQRSIDYAEEGWPEVGEIPYSCVWTARGTILTNGDLEKTPWNSGSYVEGDVVWYKPERLTSARRDANQIFAGGASGAGFAISWQEDPAGLRPGDGDGPGEGWSGATTNHKTDIWYSYILWSDFKTVDTAFEPGGDPEHDDEDINARPKWLVPMSQPVRVSDNEVLNTDNLNVALDANGYPEIGPDGLWIHDGVVVDESDDITGTHSYGYLIDVTEPYSLTTPSIDYLCPVDNPTDSTRWYDFVNYQDAEKRVCITADGRVMDGDTGAARPNLFLQTYTNPDGKKSAWAILAYEETKGVGMGPPDHDPNIGGYGEEESPDEGKSVIYHSFDIAVPDLVSAGKLLNFPETVEDSSGEIQFTFVMSRTYETVTDPATGEISHVVVAEEPMLDHLGRKILAYENARRPRFMLQGYSAMGSSRTPLLMVYKEGEDGHGRPSDIMLRRIEVPVAESEGGAFNPKTMSPYAPEYFLCEEYHSETLTTADGVDYELSACVGGAQNMSSITPTETWINPDREPDAKGDGTKVVEWVQLEDNLSDKSGENPYDDARAHRGQIRGDFVVMGYSWTPNWAASRNAHDKYDFYVRRSFDGGKTWTTDPTGEGVTHYDIFKIYTDGETEDEAVDDKRERYVIETFFDKGEYEAALNFSQLKNNKETVIEPRVVAVPGTIKDSATGEWTGIPEDKQNKNVYYVSYGTASNPPEPHGDSEEIPEPSVPLDLYYSVTQDRGESYLIDEWVVQGSPTGEDAPETGDVVSGWPWLAKHDPEQGEAQLRMTPDGSRFYATWLQEGEDGSDIWFRRIMPSLFLVNRAEIDELPTALITYINSTELDYSDEYLVVAGDAWDNDVWHDDPQIVEYVWTIDSTVLPFTTAGFSMPVTDLPLGIHTLSFKAKDNEGNWSDTVSATLTIDGAENDAPVHTMPVDLTMDEDTVLVMNHPDKKAISVYDIDAKDIPVKTSLSVDVGVLTLKTTNGLIFTEGDGNDDAVMVFTGTIDAINAALNGMTFTPPLDYYGTVVLTIITNDLGNTGEGGPKEDADTLEIEVVPDGDAKITVTIYNDLNRDGQRQDGDAGEPGLTGWDVHLYDSLVEQEVRTVVASNSDGTVVFGQLTPGDYVICQTLKSQWQNTEPGGPNDGAQVCKSVSVGADGEISLKFGNFLAGVVLTESYGISDLDEDGAPNSLACYWITLRSEPTGPVVVQLQPDAQVRLNKSSVTLTSDNWNKLDREYTTNRACVYPFNDDLVDMEPEQRFCGVKNLELFATGGPAEEICGDHLGYVRHVTSSESDRRYNEEEGLYELSYSGMGPDFDEQQRTLDVLVRNDDQPVVVLTESHGVSDVDEDGTPSAKACYWVNLAAEPVGEVRVRINSGSQVDTDKELVSLNATNWHIREIDNDFNRVCITAVNDAVDDGDPASVRCAPQSVSLFEPGETMVEVCGDHAGKITHTVEVVEQTPQWAGLWFEGNGLDLDNDRSTVDVLVRDDDEAVVQTSASVVNLVEGESASLLLSLGSQPAAPVAVTDLDGVSAALFTPESWSAEQSVTISAPEDEEAKGVQVIGIGYRAQSADPKYDGKTTEIVQVTVVDNDTPGVIVSHSSVDVAEGAGEATYTLRLTTKPASSVVVKLSGDDQLEMVDGQITFGESDWNQPHTVRVRATDDAIAENAVGDIHVGWITHEVESGDIGYAGLTVGSLMARIADNDQASITVSQPSADELSEAGQSVDYQIVLTSQPVDDVQIQIVTDGRVQADPALLTFTPGNWLVGQQVTLTSVANDVDEVDRLASVVSHSVTGADMNYSGMQIGDVQVTIVDDDTAGVAVSVTTVNVSEDGVEASYSLVLTSKPSGPVTIGIESDEQLQVTGNCTDPEHGNACVLFQPEEWAIAKTVIVAAIDDLRIESADGESHGSVLQHSVSSTDSNYSAIAVAGVQVQVVDNDEMFDPNDGKGWLFLPTIFR